jgi:hypothetical protein
MGHSGGYFYVDMIFFFEDTVSSAIKGEMKPSEALGAATFYTKTWRTPRRTFSRMDRYSGVMSPEWAHVSNKLSNLRLLLPSF